MENPEVSTEKMNPSIFDRSIPVEIALRRSKKAVLRYPTDDELADHERSYKTFFLKDSNIPQLDGKEEADIELANLLIENGSERLDEFAATEAIGKLLRTEVAFAPEADGEGYRVTLLALWGSAKIRTVHTLREPTPREKRRYHDRALWQGEPKFGRSEMRTLLSGVVNFYNSLSPKVEGYSGGVESIPANHKGAVVSAILAQIRTEEEADNAPPPK